MKKEQNLGHELKALGSEVMKAVEEMKSSKELKALEKDFTKAIKSISQSVVTALSAAKGSRSAKRLKTKLGRLVEAGTVKGKIETAKAKVAALKGIKKAQSAVKTWSKKIKNSSK